MINSRFEKNDDKVPLWKVSDMVNTPWNKTIKIKCTWDAGSMKFKIM
jgi:hypothetical protein